MKLQMQHLLSAFILSFFITASCYAQSENNTGEKPKWDYQIYLTKPAKEIKEVQYEKDCTPVKGFLSGDKKSVILKDYEQGKKVYVQVVYEDGTTEEFVRSSCYIDPVI